MKTKIIALIFLFTGLGLFVFGINIFIYNQYFYKNAISTVGVVVEVQDYKKKKIFAPIYKYTDQNNREQKSISYFTSDPQKYTVGQVLDVLYDPSNPSYSKIKDNFSPWAASIMPGLLGFVSCVIGIIVINSGPRIKN